MIGDQAGSDASAGVIIFNSLKPVTSILKRLTLPDFLFLGLFCLKYIYTLPFGAHVGPSTKYPFANNLSPDPSGFITPI